MVLITRGDGVAINYYGIPSDTYAGVFCNEGSSILGAKF